MNKKTALDSPDQMSTSKHALTAGLIVALCAASLLGWPLVIGLFRSLMRHHYSVFGAVP